MAIIATGGITLTDLNDVTVSVSAPSKPYTGQLWWKSDESQLYVYQGGIWLKSNNTIVGGRNLIRYSSDFRSGWSVFQNLNKMEVVSEDRFGKVLELTTDSLTSSRSPAVRHAGVKVTAGEIYTYSVWVRRTTAGQGIVGMLLKFIDANGANTNPIAGVEFSAQQNEWVKLVQTFTVPSGMVSVYGTPRIVTSTASTKFQIANPKLEEGNIPTDWSPAPEDTEEQIDDLGESVQTISSALSGKVDDTTYQSFVQQTANSLASKISATDVANNYVKTSTFTQTVNGIQTSVNDKVSSSQFTQLATAVDLKMSTQDANAKFATQSQLTATSGSLTSSITAVQNDLSNLEIGGRNIIRNGDFSDGLTNWTAWGGGAKSVVDITDLVGFSKAFKLVSDGQNQGVIQNYVVKPNSKYTISFWAKVDSGNGYVQLSVNKVSGMEYKNAGVANTTEWVKRVYVWNTPSDINNVTIQVGRGGGASNGVYYFTGFKFEEGTKDTSYTPAPEDTVNTATYNSYVQQTAQALSSKLSITDASNTYATQSQLTQTASSISTRISSVQTNLDELQVGGSNLYFNSANFNQWGEYNVTARDLSDDIPYLASNVKSRIWKIGSQSNTGGIYQRFRAKTTSSERDYFKNGQNYSVSIWVKSSADANIQINVEGLMSKTFTATTEWKKISLSFVGNGTSSTITFYGTDSTKNITFYACMPMLVSGDKPLDWSPAPEDIDNQFSTINQTIDGIQTTVSNKADTSTVTQLAGVVDSKISTTDANNKFATQSQLTQTSTSLTSTISQVQTNLDNLEVGGRNLVVGTKDFSGRFTIKSKSTETYMDCAVATGTGTTSGYVDTVAGWTPVLDGLEYTVSFYAKSNNETQNIVCHFYQPNTTTATVSSTGQKASNGDGNITVTVTNEWKRYWVTWKQSASGSEKRFIIGRITGTTSNVSIAGVKFEKGNKATDYSPASEDIDNQFSTINQTIDGIATKVSTAEGNISTLTQTAQGLQSAVSGKVDNSTYQSFVTQTNSALNSKISTTDANNKFATQSDLTQTASSLSFSITRRNLSNLIPNPTFVNDSIGASGSEWDNGGKIANNPLTTGIVRSDKVMMLTGRTSGNQDVYSTALIPVTAGQKIYLEGMVLAQTSGMGGTIRVGYRGYDGSRNALNNWSSIGKNASESTSWQKISGFLTIPTNGSISYIKPYLSYSGAGNTNQAYLFNPVIQDATAQEYTDSQFSSLSQTIDGIATKVSNAEGSISTLTQTAQGLQTTVSGKVDNTTYQSFVTQTNNALNSKINTTTADGKYATQSQLTQTSSSLTSTITSVQNNLDNLQVGGRNYVQNGYPYGDGLWRFTRGNEVATSSINDGEIRISNDGSSWAQWQIYSNNGATALNLLESGKQYTLSFEAKIGTAMSGDYCQAQLRYDTSGTNVIYAIGYKTSMSTDKWVRFYGTGTIPQDLIDSSTSIRIILGYSGGGTVLFRKVKLEEGNKATDWSPAPEDQATQSQISQLSDAINLRVTKDNIINQINVSTEGILISGNKVRITGQTTIDNAVIKNAMIADLSASKLTAGTINASVITVSNINASNITTGTLSASRIASNSITTDKIATNAVTANEIATGSITATNGIVASLDAGKITVGTLDSARIGANTITASKLLITDFSNLVENPNFENDTHFQVPKGYTNTDNCRVRDISAWNTGNGSKLALELDALTTGNNNVYADTRLPVTQGEAFYLSGEGKYGSSGVGTGRGHLMIREISNDGTTVSIKAVASWHTVSNRFSIIGGQYVVPSGVAFIQLCIRYSQSNETSNTFLMDNIRFNRMSNGELIVDGTITADHITSRTITADKLVSKTITASSGVIADLAIGTAQIANSAITNAKIGSLAVDEANIANGAITNAKIANATIQDAKIVSLNGTKITANSISGDKIMANTITANKITVSDFTNLVDNGTFENDTVNVTPQGWSGYSSLSIASVLADNTGNGGTGSKQVMAVYARSDANTDIIQDRKIQVREGDVLYIEYIYRTYNLSGNGLKSVGFRTYNPDGTELGWETGPSASANTYNWTKVSGTYTVPAGIGFVAPRIRYGNNGETTNRMFVDNIIIRRMASAELIVDGAITANHLNVNTLSAISANLGNVTAGNIKGVTITGSTIQTNTSGKYIKLETEDYAVYDGSTQKISLGFRQLSDGSYDVPRFAMGVNGMNPNGSGANGSYFVATHYPANSNPQGNLNTSYIDLAYRVGSLSDYSNIKMYGNGDMRIAPVRALEITTNYLDGSYAGVGERTLARFNSSTSQYLNSNLEIGAIINQYNANGLILGDDTTQPYTRVRVQTDSSGEQFFRPLTTSGSIELGSASYPWQKVFAVSGTIQSSTIKKKSDITPVSVNGASILDRNPKSKSLLPNDMPAETIVDFVENVNIYSFVYKKHTEIWEDDEAKGVMIDRTKDEALAQGDNDSVQLGVVAEEIVEHPISKYILSGYLEDDTLGVQAVPLIASTIVAIQSHAKKIDKHEDEINYLKMENQYLKQKIKNLEEKIDSNGY
ncbi:MAG: carbohydrate binding domain-containing protein [Psychrobacillus sp.]